MPAAGGPFDLGGKVAVVTGGNSGIGRSMAAALAAAGAAVSIWGRSGERNREVVAEIEANGGRASGRQVDVTDEGAVRAAMDGVMEEWGRLDACFANASGHGARSPSFIESTTEEWRATTGLVLDSVYLTLREAARVLVAQGDGGSLVATSSIAVRYGAVRGNHAYAVSKAAIITLVRGLAVELARHGIRANTIVPGWVDGPFMEEVHANPKLTERVLQRMPMRRWGRPDELGALAVYLAGDGSTWHTGDELVVAGGYQVM